MNLDDVSQPPPHADLRMAEDPPAGTVRVVGEQIVALAGRIAAATCRWLLLVAEFDRRRGAEEFGMATTSHWLGYSCGLAHRTAVEHVRVARALAAWPRLAEEMSAGRLCYSHVRVISRITGDGTGDLVDDLINVAEHGTVAQLEATVRGLRSVRDSHHSDDDPPHEYFSPGWNDSGQWRLSARLNAERGAQVGTAVAAIADAEGISPADALVRLAEIGMASLSASEQPRGRGEEDATIVVHLDADRIPAQPRSRERGAEPGRPFARVHDGPGLPDEVVERLACNGRLRTVVRDGARTHSDVLDLGRSHRVVTARQFKALLLRDGHRCAHPGCRSRRNLEAHHVRHWLYGGRTDMDNLILLCKVHHHAHHRGEFAIRTLGTGRFRFYRNGDELPTHPDPSALLDTGAPIEAEHDHVRPDAATTRWDGSRLDRDFVVWAIAPDLGLPSCDRRPIATQRAG